MNTLPLLNTKKEIKRISAFLQETFQKQHIDQTVLGLSGGIDSATSLFLLKNILPPTNIHVIHMPYFLTDTSPIEKIIHAAKLPQEQLHIISIKESVDALKRTFKVQEEDTIRLGNIMARVRMITLFDMAKKNNALVCGTENKSEYHLAYFTRFGDEASDIEPIQHLYKTHVYELAKELGVPQFVIEASPTAGLWKGQTDEKEFGFTYAEADNVLFLYLDKKEQLREIKKDFPNAEKIIDWSKKNDFKHSVPYLISS